MKITYKEEQIPEIEQLAALYNDNEWYNYTKDCEQLRRAFEKSSWILTAWDGANLVGLLRAVGDKETIMYIQDILILKKYQRQGIGRCLMKQFMDKFEKVRQKVLMTDRTEETMGFYQACGFVPTEDYDGIAYVNYSL